MVGIFLALGLGMMIGITLESQNIVENQQTNLIRQIEEQYFSLRSETEQLKKEIHGLEDQRNQLYDLSSLLLKEIVKDRFSGLHVGVVTFSQTASLQNLLEFLNLAGASIQYAVAIQPEITEWNGSIIHEVQKPEDVIQAVIYELIYSMDYGGITPLIQEAEELMLVSRTGLCEYPVDIIVLYGQGTSTLNYDNILIQRAMEAGIPIVAVEPGEVAESAVPEYKALGISTVDHVDSIYGQLALASVLSGNKGNFGLSSFASDSLPSPLFLKQITSDNEDKTAAAEEDLQ